MRAIGISFLLNIFAILVCFGIMGNIEHRTLFLKFSMTLLLVGLMVSSLGFILLRYQPSRLAYRLMI